ncbi:MAG: DUF1844 domain-containing protein [Phycisphaerales bacterium]
MSQNPGSPKLIIGGDDWKSSHQSTQSTAKPDSAAEPKPSGGLQIDSDWKNQAAAEKEKLTAQEQKSTKGKAGAAGAGAREMPEPDFKSLLGTLVTQAILYMGGFPDPQTGRAIVSLEYAQFHIDLLETLEQKTKGNITVEEAGELKQVLHELRMRYVELTQAVAEMAAERAKGGPAGIPLGGGMPKM